MALNKETIAYWDIIADKIDICSSDMTTKNILDLLSIAIGPTLSYVPSRDICIAVTSERMEESSFLKKDAWVVSLWKDFVRCSRALEFMENGKSYASKESMELRCLSCDGHSECPKETDDSKKKYCIDLLKKLADEYRGKVNA